MTYSSTIPANGKHFQISMEVVRFVPVVVEPVGDAAPVWVDGKLKFPWKGVIPEVSPYAMTWLLEPVDAERYGLCKITYL